MKVHTFIEDFSSLDSRETPVAVTLSQSDKRNIANMAPEATVYAAFPAGTDVAEMQRWLDRLKAEE